MGALHYLFAGAGRETGLDIAGEIRGREVGPVMTRHPDPLNRLLESTRSVRLPLGLTRARFFVPAIPWAWLRIVVAVLLAAGVDWTFRATHLYLGTRSAFILLALLAVMASAWAGRFLAGLLTLLLCTGQLTYYFSTPAKSFRLASIEDVRLVLLFLGAGCVLCLIVEALYAGKRYGEELALDRQQLAESLLTERQRLGALLANLPGIVWEVHVEPGDENPRPKFFSANVERLLGQPPERLLDPLVLWNDVFHPADRLAMLETLRKVARSGAPSVVRHRWRVGPPPSGSQKAGDLPIVERLFETHCGAGREATARVRCVSLDISGSESVERALAESEERFRAAADRAPILIWIAQPTAGVVWTNRAWLEFRGRALAQELGLGWVEGVHPEDAGEMSSEALAVFGRREEFRLEFRIRRADGAWRWIMALGVPRLDAAGEFQDYLGFCVDLSDRKQLEMERESLLAGSERAREAAELATRSKDEFLARISHELRNPLNGILGWTQILRRGDTSPEDIARGIELIDLGARSLTQLVDDLLDVSRIMAGKMRLSLAPTDLARVVETACQALIPSAEAKGVTIKCSLAADLPPVNGDSRRLQQIAWNLLANAVKFTPRGGAIDVRVALRKDHVVLAVRDSGVGIAPEFLSQVFSPFAQQEASSTRRYSGLGLGLSIVRTLTELHGGHVRAESPGVDQGASFEVAFPQAHGSRESLSLPAISEQPNAVESRQPLANLRILVVDDDPSAREMLPILLGKAGATVHTAESAESGLAALLSFQPHVLLSDIEMPGTDGYAFLRRVRALSDEEGGTVPAAALTAYVREEERRRVLLAGFQAHIGKPVETEILVDTVARLAGRSTVESSSPG